MFGFFQTIWSDVFGIHAVGSVQCRYHIDSLPMNGLQFCSPLRSGGRNKTEGKKA